MRHAAVLGEWPPTLHATLSTHRCRACTSAPPQAEQAAYEEQLRQQQQQPSSASSSGGDDAGAAGAGAYASSSGGGSGGRTVEYGSTAAVPEVVTNRMLKRVIVFMGTPVFGGILLFPLFYYLKVG